MSYIGLTLPRKPKRRGRITQLQESSIYSTLSKKPADLKTTDIDLSAVRVFLGDGSHRTISCTPTTTCGEILSRLLGKLGLSERAEEYALQIKYTYSEPRLADESEKISELNQHVWDSVDRIHLFWKTDSPPPMRRKRLKSFEGTLSKEESERIHENFAILSQHVQPDTEPVVVNETLARSFATAWNTGSELHKAGECGGHEPLQSIPFQPIYENTKARQLSPQAGRKYPYTLDRKPKDPTIRRRPPLGQSPTSSPRPTRKRITKDGSPQDKNDNITNETSPILQVGTHTTSVSISTRAKSVSPERPAQQSSSLFSRGGDGRRCLRRPSPNTANKGNVAAKDVDKFSFNRKKSLSEACLLTASKAEGTVQEAHSQDTLRDSGFDEPYRSCHLSINDLTSPSQPPAPRKKTVSLENFPIPSLAKYTIKAPLTKTRSLEGTSRTKVTFPQGIADPLRLKSVESCDTGAFTPVTSNSSTGPHSIVPSPPPNHPPPPPPIVPQRMSAYLKNCTVPDDYLLKQGKRISQMLNLTPKKEESRTFKFISKVGTLLKRGRTPSLAEKSPQSSPPPTKKPLGFPDTPTWKANQSPTNTIPQPKHEEVNSMGVRWSCVEYDPVSIGDNQRPVLAKNISKLSLAKTKIKVTATQQQTEGPPICKLLSDPQCLLPTSTMTTFCTMAKQHPSSTLKTSYSTNDLLSATPESDMEGHLSKTVSHSTIEDEQFDIAVPVPIPPKEPEYLEIVSHTSAGAKQPAPTPPHTYKNSECDPRGEHIYKTLPSCHHEHKVTGTQQQTEGPPICKLLSDPQCLLPTSTMTTFCTMAKQHPSSTLKKSYSTNDLLSATPEADMEGHLSKTVSHSTIENEQFDIAVPVPIPPKEPEYLEIVSQTPAGAKQPSPTPPHTYKDSEFDPRGENIYKILPSCHMYKLSAGVPPQKYENQKIEPASKNRITFEGSPLHVYEAFPSVSSETLFKDTPQSDGYVNQEIHPTPLDGIAFAGGDLHVYHVPGQQIVPLPSLPPRSSHPTHSLPSSPPSPLPLPPNRNQSHQLLPGEPYSNEPDPKKITSLGQLQPAYPEKVNHGFIHLQIPPEVPGYSKLHSYNNVMHDTNTHVTLTNPTKAADGITYRSWSTPVENPSNELQQKLKKRTALLQVATTETPPLPPQNIPSPPDSETTPLPPPPPKLKPTPELPPPLSKMSNAMMPPIPHKRPIFMPPPPPPFPPDNSQPPPPHFLSDRSQPSLPPPPPPPPPPNSKPSLKNSKDTQLGPNLTPP